MALWLAYPHQNLGALEEAFGSGGEREAFLAAIARLADLPEPALPRFGPFAAPPSRELVALSDEAGERVLVAARVYPLLAAVSRLAGKIAGNPWLAGGEVDAFGGRAEVRWDGTLWTVGNVPLAEVLPDGAAAGETAGQAGDEEREPAVAELRLTRAVAFLPAGTMRLVRRDGGLELASQEGAAALARLDAELDVGLGAAPAATFAAGDLALLAVSGPGGPLDQRGGDLFGQADEGEEAAAAATPDGTSTGDGEAAPSPAAGLIGEADAGLATVPPPAATARGAFALFSGAPGGGGLAGLLEGLPGAAVWYRPGSERFRLPAERLLTRSGLARAVGNAGGWALVATGHDSSAAAEPLTPRVDRLSAAASLALVVDPRRALAAVDRVTDVLDVVPLASGEEVRRWRDWRTALAPLAAYARLTLVSLPPPEPGVGARSDGHGALRLRLERAPRN